MGFLLVHHELLRMKARVNELTLQQSKFQKEKARIEKAIEKKNLFYDKKKSALENSFTQMKSAATNAVNNGAFGALAGFGIPTSILSGAASIFSQFNITSEYQVDLGPYGVDADGTISDVDKYNQMTGAHKNEGDQLNDAEIHKLQLSIMQQNQAVVQQLKTTYTSVLATYIDSMKEAAEQALEDEKDLNLLPLEEKDTEMDTKIATNELQLTEADAYLESLKEREKSQVKDSVPKFGLG